MKAVILAGGHGSRLRPLTYTKPKPMLPLVGKPVLQFIIESLADQGFDDVIITSNYVRERIIDHFGDGSRFGVKLTYPKEEKPLGTAGSVRNAAKYLDETFVVIQGDNVTDITFREAVTFHEEKGGIATISLMTTENPHQFGIAKLNSDGRICRFKEKPRPDECFSNLFSIGLYVLEPEVLDYIPNSTPCDFAKNVFPTLLSEGMKMYGYPAQGFWVDIGSPESYMEAVRWVLSKLRGKGISETAEVGDASIKGRVQVGERTRIESGAKIVGPAVIGGDCYVGRGSKIALHSVIESNVEVAEKTRIGGSLVYEGTCIGESSHLSRCIVAEKCNVGSGVKINKMSIIGAGCDIGDFARIYKGSRIWPKIKISVNSVVRGVITH